MCGRPNSDAKTPFRGTKGILIFSYQRIGKKDGVQPLPAVFFLSWKNFDRMNRICEGDGFHPPENPVDVLDLLKTGGRDRIY